MTASSDDYAARAPLSYRPKAINPTAFEKWLCSAEPGERLVYAEAGNLERDFGPGHRTSAMARDAYRCGLIVLTQRRVAPFRFEYIVTRRWGPSLAQKMIGDAVEHVHRQRHIVRSDFRVPLAA